MEAKFATVNGVRLSYGESAPNGPSLVFLGGWPTRWEDVGLLTADLSRDHHVYCPSLRGFGLSAHAASYRVADFAADVVAFVREVVGRPAVGIGHSGGGLWGLAAGAADPSIWTAFACLDVPLDPEAHVAHHVATRATFTGVADALRSAPSVEDLARRLAEIPLDTGELWGDLASEDELRDRAESRFGTDPAVFDPWVHDDLRGFLSVPELSGLPGAFSAPVLFVYGDPAAGSMPDADARRYNQERYPWAEVVELPGLDHGLGIYDDPSALTAAIRRFLASVE